MGYIVRDGRSMAKLNVDFGGPGMYFWWKGDREIEDALLTGHDCTGLGGSNIEGDRRRWFGTGVVSWLMASDEMSTGDSGQS